METEDMMKTEKKVYTTPEIMDYGNLIELTLGSGNSGNYDADHVWQSGPWQAPQP